MLAAGIGLGSAEGNEGMIELSGGQFMMGADTHVENSRDREGPAKPAQIKPFAIDPTPVTNQMFRQFVRKTKYRTEVPGSAAHRPLSAAAGGGLRLELCVGSACQRRHQKR